MPYFPGGGGGSSGPITPGQLPPALGGVIRYVAPDGSDSNDGDSWDRPWQYLKTAIENVGAEGGGTIYVADETHTQANGSGLEIGRGYVTPPNSVGQINNLCIIGVPGGGVTSSFPYTAPARIYGGMPFPSEEQDDPGLWLHHGGNVPVTLVNLRFQTEGGGLNKPIRIGWDYAIRDIDTGEIVKQNITQADRAAGLTEFTVEPYEFDALAVSRTSNVLSVQFDLHPGQPLPVLPGAQIYVNAVHGSFTPGWFTITGYDFVDIVTCVSVGADFGPVTGDILATCVQAEDTITVYATDGITGEFPSSTYRVTAVDEDVITCSDLYGYAPRSATASEANIGTYAAQDRRNGQFGLLKMDNVGGSPKIGVISGDCFVAGPGMDVGTLFFSTITSPRIDGYNIADPVSPGVQFGCRNPDRRASVVFDGGSTDGAFGGIMDGLNSIIGGVRVYAGLNAVTGGVFKNILTDQPVGGGVLPMPPLEILRAQSLTSIYVESIAAADATTPAIVINEDAPWDAVTVNASGCGGSEIVGPCNLIGQPSPYIASTGLMPNQANQTGWFGVNRNLAGRHMGVARNLAVITPNLPSAEISNDPDDWTITGTMVATVGYPDPFGGNRAIRLVGGASGGNARFLSTQFSTASDPSDIYAAACWVKGYTGAPTNISLSLSADGDLLDLHGYPSRNDGEYNDWYTSNVGSRLGDTGTGTGPVVGFSIGITAGQTVYIYMPSLFVVTVEDSPVSPEDISDAELAEILTNILPVPSYSQIETDTEIARAATMPDVMLVGHGGLGTGPRARYVVGVASGEITLGAATGSAVELFDEQGNSLGVVAPLSFTVNP